MNGTAFETDIARFTLQLLPPESLPSVATNALLEGFDAPSLRTLELLCSDELSSACSLFSRSLEELHIPLPDKRGAVRILATEVARAILSGSTEASEGAKAIWDLTLLLDQENMPELDPFIYAASEWDDRPEDRSMLEQGILDTARDIATQRSN